MLPTPCPWSAAADASEEHAKRAWTAAHETRTLAQCIDPRNSGSVQAAHTLARLEESQAEALEWARDFFRLAAQHPQAFSRFRESIEAGWTIAMDGPLPENVVSMMGRARG